MGSDWVGPAGGHCWGGVTSEGRPDTVSLPMWPVGQVPGASPTSHVGYRHGQDESSQPGEGTWGVCKVRGVARAPGLGYHSWRWEGRAELLPETCPKTAFLGVTRSCFALELIAPCPRQTPEPAPRNSILVRVLAPGALATPVLGSDSLAWGQRSGHGMGLADPSGQARPGRRRRLSQAPSSGDHLAHPQRGLRASRACGEGRGGDSVTHCPDPWGREKQEPDPSWRREAPGRSESSG